MTIITIDNLTLRPIKETDAPRIAELCNDLTLTRNTSRLPYPYTLDYAQSFVARAVREFAEGKEYRFGVCQNKTLIACISVMRSEDRAFELGYWVGAEARGKGVATNAATAIAQFVFEQHGATAINAGYFADNPASARVLEKLGFKATGEIVQTMSLARGEAADTVRLTLAPENFVCSQSVCITL